MKAKAVVERMKAASSVETDSALAARLHVPFGTLNSWKKRNSIPIEVLEQFSDDFDCSLDWLILGCSGQSSHSLDSLEPKAFKIGVRMALGRSALSEQESIKILDDAHFYKRIIVAHINTHVSSAGISFDEAFEELEKTIDRASDGAAEDLARNGPIRPTKGFDLP